MAIALASAALALTPAGTVITNQAELIYNSASGATETVPSNEVRTVINPVCSISVLPNGTVTAPGQSATIKPGDGAIFSYTITNSGNTTDVIPLTVRSEVPSQFTPSTMAVHRDINGNGVVDVNEPQIYSIAVAPGATEKLLVRVVSGIGARGSAFVNLVASCGVTGVSDSDNVAKLTVDDPPNFTLSKTFTPNVVKPGGEAEVNITATNSGGPANSVTVSDFLNTADMKDFVYVSGSARASGAGVLEYSADGSTWNTAAPATLAALRVRGENVPTGGTITLSFRVRAPLANVGTRRNVALLTTEGQNLEAPAELTVKPEPKIALGPVGNPEANPGGELSADDIQRKTASVVNQEICFAHTVKNLGDLPDTITTSASVQKGAATVVFKDMNGAVIAQPFTVTLDPQATRDFQACYTPTQPGAGPEALRVLLTSTSGNGAASNSTVDIIDNIGTALTPPVKTGNKGSNFVSSGEEITYTLTFTNNQPFVLNNVIVRDDLNNLTAGCTPTQGGTTASAGASAALRPQAVGGAPGAVTSQAGRLTPQASTLPPLEFVSADQGGVLSGSTVIWKFATVQPGQTITMTLKVKVPANTPDCTTITNVFTVSSDEIPNPVPSNPVPNVVFDRNNLGITKTSPQSTVVVGEQVTYILTVTNNSPTMPFNRAVLTDTFPAGLKYVEGSSTLDGAPITPTVTTNASGQQVLVWNIPGLAPGAKAEIRYRGLVGPAAAGNLQNNVKLEAVATDRVVQGNAQNTIKTQPLSFGPNNADIVGYVFIDRNRNGIYDYGSDTPVQNARVILANGRIELTDTEGRYHYRNVREGEWALRLDPNSVWQQNLRINPQESGREGSRLVYVRNLTSVDFPLAPEAGDIAVIRDTRLTMSAGPKGGAQDQFTVRKQVFQMSKDPTLYTVQLNLTACETLNGFTMTDPLPEGATLVNGENTLNIDPLPNGERTLVYQFRFTGDVKAAVTDPTANWRY